MLSPDPDASEELLEELLSEAPACNTKWVQGVLFEPPAGKRAAVEGRTKAGLPPLWTEHKARLIESYLHLFVLVTKHGTYIDGFAGPQDQPHNWTARLVLEAQPPWMKHFFLFDRDSDQVKHLEKLKEAHVDRDVQVFPGDFNRAILKILNPDVIKPTEAIFCLIDQRTFECEWATVEALARYKPGKYKVEIFYFLANRWLDRALGGLKDAGAQRARAWWGRDDWAQLQGMNGTRRAQLLADRFSQELGYQSVTPYAIFDREEGKRIMYFMIHATDHVAAPRLMADAYEKSVRPKKDDPQIPLWG
jgi:three-Cys-motif partner protein